MLKAKYEKLPKYYPEMYLDGYTPEEILNSLHKTMIEGYRNSDEGIAEIIITTKEKIKWDTIKRKIKRKRKNQY